MDDTIGEGGYGVVVKALPNGIEEFPGNVTKLYSRKKPYDHIVQLIPHLSTLLGPNEGHRMNTYKRNFLGRNLPKSIRSKLRISAYNEVYPVRMPHLGFDITTVIQKHEMKDSLRQCPLPILIGQIIKLIGQINRLGSQGYIHGDIRDKNLMIQPSTGTITLIDFDWMMPFDQFYDEYPFNFYSNPPEFLMKEELPSLLVDMDLKADTLVNAMPELTPYTIEFESFFYFSGFVYENIEKEVVSANMSNVVYLLSNSLKSCLSMFDSFGLACTLLTLFHSLYPECCDSTISIDDFKTSIRGSISKKGEPYTEQELEACSVAILNLTQGVLLPMASFTIQSRMSASTALAHATQIQSELSEAFFASNSMKDPMNEDGIRRQAMGHLAILAAQKGNTSVLKRLVNATNKRARRTRRKKSGSI